MPTASYLVYSGGFFPWELNGLERETEYSPLSSAEVKNGWSYTSFPPNGLTSYAGTGSFLLLYVRYFINVRLCVVLLVGFCMADIFLHIWDTACVRISDKPHDVRMFANDKLHNTSGAIQLEVGPKHVWPSW